MGKGAAGSVRQSRCGYLELKVYPRNQRTKVGEAIDKQLIEPRWTNNAGYDAGFWTCPEGTTWILVNHHYEYETVADPTKKGHCYKPDSND